MTFGEASDASRSQPRVLLDLYSRSPALQVELHEMPDMACASWESKLVSCPSSTL